MILSLQYANPYLAPEAFQHCHPNHARHALGSRVAPSHIPRLMSGTPQHPWGAPTPQFNAS